MDWKREYSLSDLLRRPRRGEHGAEGPPGQQAVPPRERTLPDIPLLRSLDLLPRDAGPARARVRPRMVQGIAVALAALLLCVVGLAYASGRDGVSDRRAALADRESRIADLQARQPVPVADGSALAGEALARAGALSAALAGRTNWDRLLRELSLTLPDDVWFTTMQTQAPAVTEAPAEAGAPPPAPAAQTLVITGYSRDQAGVGHLLSRLSVIPEFSDVRLTTAQRQTIADLPVIQFSVVGVLRQPGQVAP